MKKLGLLLVVVMLLGACASSTPEATPTPVPTSIPAPTNTPVLLATPTSPALTEASFIEPIKKQIYRELEGTDHAEVAKRWGISVDAAEEIVLEGREKGWFMPEQAEATPEPVEAAPTPELLPTPTPKPPATQKTVYTAPLVLATISGKGDTITDNFQLPACQQAVVYWSVSPSDDVLAGTDIRIGHLNVYLHKGTQESLLISAPFLFSSSLHNGWVFQSFDGGIYYLLTKTHTDASWTIRVECRDGIAPIQTGIDLHATGDIITDPYELPACQKSVFVWSVEPDDSSSASTILQLALCGKDLNCITIVDVIEMHPTATLKGETLQPLSGGVYFLVSKKASGQAWSVRWECRD